MANGNGAAQKIFYGILSGIGLGVGFLIVNKIADAAKKEYAKSKGK